ncbi:MAG TPA: CvpA family protein, partial [Candidatus Limiplasma sp.]|nr:CvpA family protein [Candidatus Limiplasma sp.]
MTYIDYGIIISIIICIILGLSRGFVLSLLNFFGGVLAFCMSFRLAAKFSELLRTTPITMKVLSAITDAATKSFDISDYVNTVLDASDAIHVLDNIGCPEFFANIIQKQLPQQTASSVIDYIDSIMGYIRESIYLMSSNIISYILCFIACFLSISLIIRLLKKLFHFPVLQQLDGVLGGIFGLFLGCLLCVV